MTPTELRELAAAIFEGKWGWQTKLAETLGVDSRTVRRWLSGELPIPKAIAVAVRCMAREAARQTKRTKKTT